MRARLLHPRKRLLALRAHVVLELGVLRPGLLDGGIDLSTRRQRRMSADHVGERIGQLVEQAFLQMVFFVIGQPRIEEGGRPRLTQLVDVEAQRLGIARHDGAVVVIASTLVFLTFPFGARHPDEVGVLLEKVHYMSMAELRRIANRLARHGLDPGLVGLLGRRIAQNDTEAEAREKREPEGIVLVHVERTRNAHRPARSLIGRQRLVIEQPVRLVVEQVRNIRFLVDDPRALFAPIARDEAPVLPIRPLAEIVNREQAMVRTFLASHRPMRRVQLRKLLRPQNRRPHPRNPQRIQRIRGTWGGRASGAPFISSALRVVGSLACVIAASTIAKRIRGDRASGAPFISSAKRVTNFLPATGGRLPQHEHSTDPEQGGQHRRPPWSPRYSAARRPHPQAARTPEARRR